MLTLPNLAFRSSVLFALLMAANLFAFAQSENWRHHSIVANVTDIAEEGEYLWIATNTSGLLRFHKETHEITHFDPCTSGLHRYEIYDIAIDSKGVKWIATSDGLARFDNENWEFHFRTDRFHGRVMQEIAIDHNDHVWVGGGSTGKGVSIYDGENWTNYNSTNSPIGCDQSLEPYVDDLGHVWLSGCLSLFEFDGSNWKVYNEHNSQLVSHSIYGLETDKDGMRWFATAFGLMKFDGNDFQLFDRNNSAITHYGMNCLALDDEDRKWMGNTTLYGVDCRPCLGGVSSFDGEIFDTYNADNSQVKDERILAILVDQENRVWAAGREENLYEFDGEEWHVHSLSNIEMDYTRVQHIAVGEGGNWILGTMPFGHFFGGSVSFQLFDGWNWNQIKEYLYFSGDMEVDTLGNLWIANERVLDIKTKGGNRSFHIPGPYDPWEGFEHVLTPDGAGGVWLTHYADSINTQFGTQYNRGIAHYDGNGWQIQSHNWSNVPCFSTNLLRTDQDGDLWMVCNGSIYEYAGSVWTEHRPDSHFGADNISTLEIDRNNHVWISAVGVDLLEFDGVNWTLHNHVDSLHYFNGWEFLDFDADGDVWGLDQDKLLFHYDKESWTGYSIPFGPLPFGTWKLSFAIDHLGNKLIGSDKGLTIFNENSIADFPTSPIPEQSELVLFPNPATHETTLSFYQFLDGPVEMRIWNLQGKLVKSRRFDNALAGTKSYSFPINDLSQGVYLVRVKSSNEELSAKLVVVD